MAAAHSLKNTKQLGDGGIHHPSEKYENNHEKYFFGKNDIIILKIPMFFLPRFKNFIHIRGEYSRGGVHIPTPSKNNLFSTGGGRFNHPIHFLFTIFIIFLFFTYFCCQINIYHLPIFCYRGNVINLITYTPAAHSLKSAKQLGDGGIHHPLRRIRKNGKKICFYKKLYNYSARDSYWWPKAFGRMSNECRGPNIYQKVNRGIIHVSLTKFKKFIHIRMCSKQPKIYTSNPSSMLLTSILFFDQSQPQLSLS